MNAPSRCWLGLAIAVSLGACSFDDDPVGTPAPSGGVGGAGGAGSGGASGVGGSPMQAGTSGNPTGGVGGMMVPSAGAGGMDSDAAVAIDAAFSDASDAAALPNGTGPGDWGPGDYPSGLSQQLYLQIEGVSGQGELVREYKVHVPPSYDPDVPMPLVFCIHGLGQNAVMFCVDVAGMPAKADAEGFIVVMPNGYFNSWNGGTCCGEASTMQLDDVALMRAIFAEVGTHLNVDLGRVYATGLSNGAYLSYRLACEAADIFVAVAPGSGAIGKNDIGGGTNPASAFTTCEPTDKVSILALHGDADILISPSLVAPSLNHFASQDGCGLTTEPATVPMQGGDTSCITYTGCSDGIEVTGCTVTGGGHIWFGTTADSIAGIGADSTFLINTDAAWAFFERLSR